MARSQISRSQITLFVIAILIVTFAISAKSLADWFGVGMAPFSAQAPIAPDGLRMREEFRVWRHCTFELGVRLDHERLGQFDSVLVEKRTLPWTLQVNVHRLDDDSQRVLQIEQQPLLVGKGANTTTFKLGFAAVPRGRYRIEVVGAEPPVQLVGNNLDVFVQVRPKSSCGT